MNHKQLFEDDLAFARRCVANASDCVSEAIYAVETGQLALGWLRNAYELQQQAIAALGEYEAITKART